MKNGSIAGLQTAFLEKVVPGYDRSASLSIRIEDFSKDFVRSDKYTGEELVSPNAWFAVINPIAGKGKATRWTNMLETLCKQGKIELKLATTRFRGDAIALAHEGVIKGYRKFLAVGGDGTASEVVEGLFTQRSVPTRELTISTLPTGTGNDWARTLNMPRSCREAVQILSRGYVTYHDIGKVEYLRDGQIKVRHFMNMAGVGIDAFIVHRLGERRPGVWAYYLELLKAAWHFSAPTVSVSIDGFTISSPVLAIFANLGRFGGGGMKLAPDASIDDGMFNLKVVHRMNGLQVLGESRRLLLGSLGKSRFIREFTTPKARIESCEAVPVQADGELLGTTPVCFTVLPRAIRVLAALK